eukprot:TRINITY_DN9106_c0_g1_i1.p1 TRINITY_DN9106_c0_g1~~TRINITY_DN9106_c0_g1_i1.p1  ORF type:complete len:336 (+),score=130.47 TRINITY_DN9106_c0_g1_i1:84-1010(+)
MYEAIPGDSHYMALCAVVTVGMQLCFYAIAATFKFDLVTDFAGGTNFIVLMVLTLILGDVYSTRQIVTVVLFCVTRLWLAGFLLFRVCKRGKDDRFDEMREKPLAFLVFWIFQMFWAWTVSLPVTWLNGTEYDPDLGTADVVAFALMGVGALFEIISDVQKYKFRNNPDNRGRICDAGLWRFSRHPNYFGEVAISWGTFAAVSSVFDDDKAGWCCIAGPLFTMLILLGGSGIPTGEGSNLARYYKTPESAEMYEKYRNQTPPLIPFLPPLYRCMPMALKRLLCFEFPCYEFPDREATALGGASAKKAD